MDPETVIALSKTSYRKLFDSLPGALLIMELIYDQSGNPIERRILDVNTEFENFFGLGRNELLGRKTADFFLRPPAGCFDRYDEVFWTGKSMRFESFCEKQGRWYDLNIVPLEDGKKCAFIFADITEERKAAELRRKSEAKQAYLLALGDILWTLNGAEAIRDAAIDLLRKHLRACRVSFTECSEDYSVSNGEKANLTIPIVQHGKPAAYLTVTPSTARIWTEDEVYVVRATAQRTWLAVERARALEALRKSEQTALTLVEKLETADKSKNEMIAILSHELRNPMAVIAAALDLLELDSRNSESQETIGTMRAQIEQLTMIVDDLRDLTRICGHGLQLMKETIDLRAVVADITRCLDSAFEEKGIKLEQSMPVHPVIVNVDPLRIAQSLENVLANALRFTPKNGTVKLALQCTGNAVLIKVKDEGPGISPKLLDHVFEPFVQGGRPRQRGVTGGVGVGLAIVRDVFTGHNGWVKASNDESGMGALFTLSLPLCGGTGPQDKTNSATKCNLRILCIEDNVDLVQMLQAIFETLGHEAHLAYNGKDGLKKAEELEPDIIFCDLGLEDITGFDVAKRIKGNAKLKDTLLVALTGYTSASDKQRAKQSGFDLHVAKPFQIATIEGILAEFSAKKE